MICELVYDVLRRALERKLIPIRIMFYKEFFEIRLNFVYYAKNDIAEIDILKRYQRTVLYKLGIAYISTSQYFKTIYIKSYTNYTKQEHKYT